MNCGIYIHIPYCKSKCGYCSFCSSNDFSNVDLYIDSLKNEIKTRSDKNIICDTIYIGGGTPSILPQGKITEIFDTVRHYFNIAANSEITIEANPDSCTTEFLQECKSVKVNRLSLGLQSTDDRLLKLIGRPHTYNDFLIAFDNAINCGFKNISADLMLGLPTQTMQDLIITLDKVTNLSLNHISVYALKIEEGTPFYHQSITINEDSQATMYDITLQKLENNGFLRYEVSNFAKNNFYSRHNNKYWILAPYLGFGLSAHSFTGNNRIENTSNISSYLVGKYIQNTYPQTQEDLIQDYIMLSIRASNGIDLNYLKTKFDYDLYKTKNSEIENLIKNNLIEFDNSTIKLTKDSYYIMNSIILKLM